MTTRKVFTIMFVANLLTVVLVTAAFQAGGIVASPAPRTVGDAERAAAHDPNLRYTVPTTMSYQGILKDSSGNPLNGTHNLTFTIYWWQVTPSTQWINVWSETQNNVQVTNGLFNVELGSVNPLTSGDIFTGEYTLNADEGSLRLGIRVDSGTELPRIPLVTVPYAFRADYVNRFPTPHWNSGWYTIAQGEAKTWTHNLGGNVDNYVVDMQFKGPSGGIHHEHYGGGYDNIGGWYGAYWHSLTTSQIKVFRASGDWAVEQVRVRIWRIE
jgi:hypothetical protein